MSEATPSAPPARAIKDYNLSKASLALDGYDPVAYFPEGGGVPTKGDARFEFSSEGATYRFATRQSLERFKQNPGKYEPAYGGWCAYAMGNDGTKVEVDPKSFTVENSRLFLFYKDWFNDTRKTWLKDGATLLPKADSNWQRLSGEMPRTGVETGKASAQSLQAQLDEKSAAFSARMPKETQQLYEAGIRQVAESGVLNSAMKVGATAPDFTLNDATGSPVRLKTLLESGPVVLTWYRGGWCPYCNIQLSAYQQALGEIKAAGGQLVALSPERPDASLSTVQKNSLEFVVLSDRENGVARQYGVVYTLPAFLIEKFKGGLDLPKINGDESWQLPLAATYVISREGTIVHAFVDADYRKRDEPSAIIAALKQLK